MIFAKGMSAGAQFLTVIGIMAALVFFLFVLLLLFAGWIDAGTARTRAQAEHHLGAAENQHAQAWYHRARAQRVEVDTAITVDVHRRRVRELEEARARRALDFDHVPDNPFDEIYDLPALAPARKKQPWWEKPR